MTKNRKWMPAVLAAAALGIAAVSNGCSAAQGVCCTDFKPGTNMANLDVGLSGAVKGQFTAFAQGAGDLVAAVGALTADVTDACKNIAVDLGADPKDPDPSMKAVDYWCGLAVTQIGSFKGSASITLTYQPPQCSVDVQASANCNARCDVSGMCDVNATPPKCTGGTLEVSCSGSCDVQSPGVAFDCEGSCSGKCEGTCEATGGAVMCNGKCEGTCMGTLAMDGTCMGTCQGKCTLSAPMAGCTGTCRGKCDAKCTAAVMGGSVKCSGKCDAKATPLECKGGKLEVMCNVDAQCKANCDASVQAKAECKPPVMKVTVSGMVDAKANQLIATLEHNLPIIAVAVKARGQAFVDLLNATVQAGVTVSGKIDASNLKAVSCGVIIGSAIGASAAEAAGTITAAGKVAGAVGM
jgi:hypothetical protein